MPWRRTNIAVVYGYCNIQLAIAAVRSFSWFVFSIIGTTRVSLYCSARLVTLFVMPFIIYMLEIRNYLSHKSVMSTQFWEWECKHAPALRMLYALKKSGVHSDIFSLLLTARGCSIIFWLSSSTKISSNLMRSFCTPLGAM